MKTIITFLTLVLLVASCGKTELPTPSPEPRQVIATELRFDAAESDTIYIEYSFGADTITERVIGNCFSVTADVLSGTDVFISASGMSNGYSRAQINMLGKEAAKSSGTCGTYRTISARVDDYWN